MTNGLKKYFPMIRTKTEILQEIRGNRKLNETYERWNSKQQEEFLNFLSGMKGAKILYDSFFKAIFDPESVPERLEAFLSLLLKQKIKIKNILPTDNNRIAEESSLLIMDILVELEDGSLANVECQKLGYKFPGQRCACYSADLLLRQYKRVRGEKKKEFSYRDIKKVYTIVLFETSLGEFHKFPKDYVHYAKTETTTGLELDFLQEYILIPLDIFRENLYNRGIRNQLDAWLTFLSVDDVIWIEKLIRKYPQFIPLYEDVYTICLNMERVMGMFSEELRILDRNTARLMIDEMQEKIDKQAKALSQKDEVISQKDEALGQKDKAISQMEEEIFRLKKLLNMKEGRV